MSEIVFQGKGEPAIPIPAGETWTLKYAAYDAFGLIGLIESPSVDVATQEVLVEVPPASIDITKFATGITPVGLVDTLPAVSGYTGSPVVLLSTDGQLYRLTAGVWTRAVPAASVTGQLTAAQIASINAAQIAGQIGAAQIASIAAGQVTGQLTAAQIASINAAQIAGQISGAQIQASTITSGNIASGTIVAGNIASGTITATQISAGTITATQIATGTITAGNIAAGTITAGNIAAGTITAAQIATDTITANNIAANAITSTELAANSVIAGKIQAGAITATEIAAGSLTADRLVSGGRGNMLHNGALYHSDVGEAIELMGPVGGYGVITPPAYATPSTSFSINGEARGTVGFNKGNDAAANSYVDYAFAYRNSAGNRTSFIPVNQSQFYEFSARLAVHRTRAEVYIFWYDSAFNFLGFTTPGSVSDPTNLATQGGTNGNNYTQAWTKGQAPANTVWARAGVRRYGTNAGQADSWLWVARGYFAETTSTSTQPTPWAAPGTTLIQGGSIATGTVTADQIAANSISAVKIVAGSITADRLNVANLSAISANLGAITGGSININNKFIVDNAGNVTLQSSPTGQRLVLTNSRLEVYDASNVLRVRLGIF